MFNYPILSLFKKKSVCSHQKWRAQLKKQKRKNRRRQQALQLTADPLNPSVVEGEEGLKLTDKEEDADSNSTDTDVANEEQRLLFPQKL